MNSGKNRAEPSVLDAVLLAFRQRGFEACTMSVLSDATGLARASLYHRFPGGKVEMASAAMDRFSAQFGDQVLAPLKEGLPAKEAIAGMLTGLSRFYEGGELSCLFEVFSRGEIPEDVRKVARRSLAEWQTAMTECSRMAGRAQSEAEEAARQAVVDLAGILVVGRVMDDPGLFRSRIAGIGDRLLPG